MPLALASSYLIAFAQPDQVTVDHALTAALGAGAAALWALGTVLGKRLSDRLPPAKLTALRFGFGLPVAALLVLPFGSERVFVEAGWVDAAPLVGLALVPGLAALLLYYRGLREAPAAAATIAELTFPLSALLVNAAAFGDRLSQTQVAGAALLALTVTALGVRSRRGPYAVGVRPSVGISRQWLMPAEAALCAWLPPAKTEGRSITVINESQPIYVLDIGYRCPGESGLARLQRAFSEHRSVLAVHLSFPRPSSV